MPVAIRQHLGDRSLQKAFAKAEDSACAAALARLDKAFPVRIRQAPEKQELGFAAAVFSDTDETGRNDLGIVDDKDIAFPEIAAHIPENVMRHRSALAVKVQQTG